MVKWQDEVKLEEDEGKLGSLGCDQHCIPSRQAFSPPVVSIMNQPPCLPVLCGGGPTGLLQNLFACVSEEGHPACGRPVHGKASQLKPASGGIMETTGQLQLKRVT